MVLGPSSSRLVKMSSFFVQQVQLREEDGKGVFLYSFIEKPELSSEINWSVSKYLAVGSNGRKVENEKSHNIAEFTWFQMVDV